MNQYVILILLFITFNANAIESSMMMASMDSEKCMSMSGDHHKSTSDASNNSAEIKLAGSEPTTCDEDSVCNVCLTHCTNSFLQVDVPSISLSGLLKIEFDYTLSEISNVYTLLLRPPKLP